MKSELKYVQQVLREWDPIGVQPGRTEDSAPLDEYDSYAPEVLSRLRSGASSEGVLELLTEIRTRSLELPACPEKDRPIADHLVNWWKDQIEWFRSNLLLGNEMKAGLMLKKKEYLLFAVSLAVLAAFVVGLSRNETARYIADRLFSKKDAFLNTVNTVSLDKPNYAPGDDILLRFKFESAGEKEVEVRYFETLEHSIQVYLSFPEGGNNATYKGIEEAELAKRPPGNIKSVMLNKAARTAEVLVQGRLSETDASYVVEFPDLNRRFSISKTTYAAYGQLRLSGYLKPVNPGIGDALEDSVPAIPFLIVSSKSEDLENLRLAIESSPTDALTARYLQAFPRTCAAFYKTFYGTNLNELYSKYEEHLSLLNKLFAKNRKEVVSVWFGVAKECSWEADAVGMLQHQLAGYGASDTKAFAAELLSFPPGERSSIIRFLADVENHDAYDEYKTIQENLKRSGNTGLEKEFAAAKKTRMAVLDH